MPAARAGRGEAPHGLDVAQLYRNLPFIGYVVGA